MAIFKNESHDFSSQIPKIIDLGEHGQINVIISRKKMKNLRMRLKDGSVIISAPKYASNRAISAFITDNNTWIEKAFKMAKMADLRPNFMDLDQLEQLICELVDRWSQIIGVKATKVRFRDMTTRWGVCNSTTGILTFNKKLTNYPPDCAEYVVVHELCHLLIRPKGGEGAHCKRFWEAVESFLPGWKQLRKQLR